MNLAIVAHFAYGAMSGGTVGHVGGVERQTTLLARWLASRGHRVSLLTWDEGDPGVDMVDGVRIVRMCRRDSGIPGLRFFHPRWSSLVAAMKSADADLYYQNCAEYVTGQVALWCRSKGRPFVYSVASDPDCDPGLPKLKTIRERVLYRCGLRLADRVIVQTRNQHRMLRDGFGIESVVLPMPCPGPEEGEYEPRQISEDGKCRVLWAGRISRTKRLEILLDIAELLTDVTFDVAGSPDIEDEYSRGVLERARSLRNVKVHGKVGRDGMDTLYRHASILCCTSVFEGFPNTYLEAWSHGVPVVSSVDPDGLIRERGIGVHGNGAGELIAGIRHLMSVPGAWREASGNARRYYLENHVVAKAMPRFEEQFQAVSNVKGRR